MAILRQQFDFRKKSNTKKVYLQLGLGWQSHFLSDVLAHSL